MAPCRSDLAQQQHKKKYAGRVGGNICQDSLRLTLQREVVVRSPDNMMGGKGGLDRTRRRVE